MIKWMAIGAAAVGALTLAAGQLGAFAGKPPVDLGVRDGRLKPPSDTPNSVSSQALLWPRRESAYIAPLAVHGDGPATLARLQALLQDHPGATVVDSRPDYLYVRCTSRLMKYVDDLEFWFDPQAKVIQVRSASRVGSSDFGVNRQRIEALRERLAAS